MTPFLILTRAAIIGWTRLAVFPLEITFDAVEGELKRQGVDCERETARAPIGWIDFCGEHPGDCANRPSMPRDVVLSTPAWKDLTRVNLWVNSHIKPMTDLEHYGVIEKWTYPEDGYGDCEDYVLLKRRMLMQSGWPREALLITVVRDRHGDGHAVLTVKTDKGELILDNQNDEIRLWSDTGYRFVKRQSQADPNVWISLGDPRAAPSTAASR